MVNLRELDIRNNAEHRLAHQVTDLIRMKQKARKEGLLEPHVIQMFDAVIELFIWLYDNGFSLSKDPKGQMTDEQRKYYEAGSMYFQDLQEWFRQNPVLLEELS